MIQLFSLELTLRKKILLHYRKLHVRMSWFDNERSIKRNEISSVLLNSLVLQVSKWKSNEENFICSTNGFHFISQTIYSFCSWHELANKFFFSISNLLDIEISNPFVNFSRKLLLLWSTSILIVNVPFIQFFHSTLSFSLLSWLVHGLL